MIYEKHGGGSVVVGSDIHCNWSTDISCVISKLSYNRKILTIGRANSTMFKKECCPECRYIRIGTKSLVYGLTIGLVWVLATVGLFQVAGVI